MTKSSEVILLEGVNLINKKIPGMFSQFDLIIPDKDKAQGVTSSAVADAYHKIRTYINSYVGIRDEKGAMVLFTTLYQWRINKVIYRFDKDLYKTLTQPDTNERIGVANLPVDVITSKLNRPIFIENDLYEYGIGTLFWIDRYSDGKVSLVLTDIPDNVNKQSTISNHIIIIELTDGITISQAVRSVCYIAPNSDCSDFDYVVDKTIKQLSLLLYVLSDNADIDQDSKNKKTYRPIKLNAIKDKYREIKIMNVGYNIADQINDMYSSIEEMRRNGNTKVYLRSGHWRTSITGGKNSDKSIKLNWIMPSIVNPSDEIADNCTDTESDNNNDRDQIDIQKKLDELNAAIDNRDKEIARLTRMCDELKRKMHDIEISSKVDKAELASLREIAFNIDTGNYYCEDTDTSDGITFPWYTSKKITVFGGHKSWLFKIKKLLPNVRFIDTSSQSVNTNVIKTSDVIWLQTNSMAHSDYDTIMNIVRRYDKPLKYFSYASSEKCAIQLVEEMSK